MGIDLQEGKDILSDLFSLKYQEFNPEYIFHLAAIPRVAYSMENPHEVLRNNILTTLDVLEFARLNNVKRVVYSSSSSVCGNGDGPTSPYGASKLIPETLCKNYSKVFGVDTVCLRYFNVYSKNQKADGPYATAVANWMKYIREERAPFITGTGEQRRDMLHVRDAVSANLFCMEYTENFEGAHYDVGTGENISLNEMRKMVQEIDSNIKFQYVSERLGDVMLTKADVSPLRALGFEIKISIEEGLKDCFTNLKGEKNENYQ